MTASNDSFSAPDQVPRTWTVPPSFPDVPAVPHALSPKTPAETRARTRINLPIIVAPPFAGFTQAWPMASHGVPGSDPIAASLGRRIGRSEEHTSELQSQSNLVCRLLL